MKVGIVLGSLPQTVTWNQRSRRWHALFGSGYAGLGLPLNGSLEQGQHPEVLDPAQPWFDVQQGGSQPPLLLFDDPL
jgi:hypothetical protein